MRRIKAKVIVLEANRIPPLEVDLDCPVCGNDIALLINPETEEVLEIYADASDEGDHKVSCGVCDSKLQWKISKQIINPSKRREKGKNEI